MLKPMTDQQVAAIKEKVRALQADLRTVLTPEERGGEDAGDEPRESLANLNFYCNEVLRQLEVHRSKLPASVARS